MNFAVGVVALHATGDEDPRALLSEHKSCKDGGNHQMARDALHKPSIIGSGNDCGDYTSSAYAARAAAIAGAGADPQRECGVWTAYSKITRIPLVLSLP